MRPWGILPLRRSPCATGGALYEASSHRSCLLGIWSSPRGCLRQRYLLVMYCNAPGPLTTSNKIHELLLRVFRERRMGMNDRVTTTAP